MFNDGLKHFLPFSLKWMDEEKMSRYGWIDRGHE